MPNDDEIKEDEFEEEDDFFEDLDKAIALEEKQIALEQKERFHHLPIKQAVSELEEMPPEKIRGALAAYGVLDDPIMLRETTEASLKLVGDEEHSAIIAVLEPDEIKDIISISPLVFSTDAFDLIHPADYDDKGKWLLITLEQKEQIIDSGDKRLIDRLCNLHPDGHKDGPWGIFKDHVKISPEAVFAYVSAICCAKRDCEWQEQAIKSIGLSLVAFAAREIPEIIDRCQAISDSLAETIKKMKINGQILIEAISQFDEAVDKLAEEAVPARQVDDSQEALSDLVERLRKKGKDSQAEKAVGAEIIQLKNMGVADPLPADIEAAVEMQVNLDTILKAGIPEEE